MVKGVEVTQMQTKLVFERKQKQCKDVLSFDGISDLWAEQEKVEREQKKKWGEVVCIPLKKKKRK